MEEFRRKAEEAFKTYEAIHTAVNKGTRWVRVHLVALIPGDLYVVRRVFLDGTVGQPVAARWTFEHSWLELKEPLLNEKAAGIEVWV